VVGFAYGVVVKRLLFALLAACGTSTPAPTPTPTRTPTPTPTQEATVETDESRARDFIAKLAKHDFAAATATFDEKMSAALPKEKLQTIWTQLESQAGTFKSVDAVDVKDADGVRIALAKVSFERAPLLFRVVLDSSHRVTGFFMSPGDTASGWKPPAYANADAFEEKRVAVSSSPALPGTLTLPKNAKNVPAVVLVHGSGPNDEDETIGALKVFKDLAWGLASRGVAVLRYDKRTRVGGGAKTQKEEVEDAAHAAIALLHAQPEVDPARIALLGHSQGAYLAPRIAKDDPAIKRVVVLAGPTRSLEDSIVAQLRYFASLQPNDAKLSDAIKDAERFKKDVENHALKADDVVKDPFGTSLPGAYFLDVRGYHPERVAAQLSIPILVLQGERDYQVTLADDFPAWKSALASKKNVTLRTYPGLTHAFTRGEGPPSPAEYEKPEHVDEKVIDDIAAFLKAP
jgi:dipeptidyl aminopeptidase/acylaminoacyl peptidase